MRKRKIRTVLLALSLLTFSRCTSIDNHDVQARLGVPQVAETGDVAVDFDPAKPRYLLVVEPVREQGAATNRRGSTISRSSSIQEGQVGIAQQDELTGKNASLIKDAGRRSTSQSTHFDETQWRSSLASNQLQITRQFISALAGIGNFVVRDFPSGEVKLTRQEASSGMRGPYQVRAVITEWVEDAEVDSKRLRVPGLGGNKSRTARSIVALDIQLVDFKTKNILRSFPVRSTYSAAEAKNEVALLAPIYTKENTARSAIDQALRMALNEAARKIAEGLL